MADEAKARILLVDDDPIVLDSLGKLLAADGYEISTASDVPGATAVLTAGRVNLVITDVSMPTCDGFELLRYVRGHHEDVQVILMTGYGTIEAAVEAIKQGAYDYLTKPIIDDDVRMAVRRALARQDLLAENRSLRQALAARSGTSTVIAWGVTLRSMATTSRQKKGCQVSLKACQTPVMPWSSTYSGVIVQPIITSSPTASSPASST